MREIFVPIIGYEGLYEVSNFGNVKSLKNNIVLKNIVKSTGYLAVTLYKDKKAKMKFVHRLVAEHFSETIPYDHVVNHKDGNKFNNHIENLEWVTQQRNILHSYDNGLQKPLRSKSNPKSKKVNQYDLDGNFIKTWNSVMDIERELGFKSGAISNCCLGKCKKTKGYIWKYIERNDDLSD